MSTTISASDVKALRERTGAGMMDCKKALVENDGDLDAAVEYLQVKGIAKAAKKAGRVAAEGLIGTVVTDDGRSAVMVEVNCETDFVARNEKFQEFVQEVAALVAGSDASTVDEALQLTIDGGTLEEYTKETITTIGENIQLRRFVRFTQPEGLVASYVHAGNQIGVLVSIRGNASDEARDFARDVAMHIAAMNPGYLSTDQIDAEAAARQEELFSAQVAEEGKPAEIVPKIVAGKIAKWKKEQALLEQPFVKDPDVTVGKLQNKLGGLQLVEFTRFEVGQGIEKQESNLADEVAAQLKGGA